MRRLFLHGPSRRAPPPFPSPCNDARLTRQSVFGDLSADLLCSHCAARHHAADCTHGGSLRVWRDDPAKSAAAGEEPAPDYWPHRFAAADKVAAPHSGSMPGPDRSEPASTALAAPWSRRLSKPPATRRPVKAAAFFQNLGFIASPRITMQGDDRRSRNSAIILNPVFIGKTAPSLDNDFHFNIVTGEIVLRNFPRIVLCSNAPTLSQQ